MEINMSKNDIKDISKQVKEQIVGDIASGEFSRIIGERIDQRANAYMQMSMEQDMLGDVFYKEIQRFFDNEKVRIAKMVAEILEEKLGDAALREHIVGKVEQALGDLL